MELQPFCSIVSQDKRREARLLFCQRVPTLPKGGTCYFAASSTLRSTTPMKDNYLAAQYHRVARRRGREKAIVVGSHSLLVIMYHVLREKKPDTDLGADSFDKLATARIERHHVRRLAQLGYTVTLTPAHAA